QAKADFFKILGHPARIRILELLSERDHAVHELLERIESEPSNLPQQLAILRRNSLVVPPAERRGRLLRQRALLDEHIVAHRIDGPLFFAAAHGFLLELSLVSNVRVVVLRMSRVTTIDATGVAHARVHAARIQHAPAD
ncbi:MAG TPA: ArsR family transcriptional regulator, partial [Nocardioides sp.]|uniref:ArsR family transcriptional regulator n=1 Tax=Nocardioides sp. TaxID=35761 RepID=UPI002CE4F11C